MKSNSPLIIPLNKLGKPLYRIDLLPYIILSYIILNLFNTNEVESSAEILSNISVYCPLNYKNDVCNNVQSFFTLASSLLEGIPKLYPLSNVPVQLLEPLANQKNTILFQRMIYIAWSIITLIVVLLPVWSSKYKLFTMYSSASSLHDTTHLYVKNKTNESIYCQIENGYRFIDKNFVPAKYIKMKEKKYYIDLAYNESAKYATHKKSKFKFCLVKDKFIDKLSLDDLTNPNKRLYISDKITEQYSKVYSKNIQNIPVPSIVWLLFSQLTHPLFIFQLLCNLLYFLDDMWQYSSISLIMTIGFELKIVMRRKSDFITVMQMKLKPITVALFRNNTFYKISSNDLMPGDIYSICTDKTLNRLKPYAEFEKLPKTSFKNDGEGLLIPCDSVIIRGNAIVNEAILTGESLPQMKTELVVDESNKNTLLDINSKHKVNCVFSGTKLIMTSDSSSALPGIDKVDGCILYCLRTGFETLQGKLLQSVLASKTQNNHHVSVEAIIFIIVLTIIAIVASLYVLIHSWSKPYRNHYKLLLHCIMIITSVISPELPITLSLTINRSVTQLIKNNIYCTVPQKLVNAGKVTCCCFDKTGTLTSIDVKLSGVAIYNNNEFVNNVATDNLKVQLNYMTRLVMGLCNSLIHIKNEQKVSKKLLYDENGKSITEKYKVIGDPLEKAAMSYSGFVLDELKIDSFKDTLNINSKCNILKRYPFTSFNQRMTVIVNIDGTYYVLMKGAASRVKEHLNIIPDNYDSYIRSITIKGKRVIVLAYKKLNINDIVELEKFSRLDIENNLNFIGFMYFHCPYKTKTLETITTLKATNHLVKMITGDDPITAVNVAQECGIIDESCNLYQLELSSYTIELTNIVTCTKEIINIDAFNCETLYNYTKKNYAFVMDGATLETMSSKIGTNIAFAKILKNIAVFARVTPQQKEQIIMNLNLTDEITLMCGDGTNDVGALKTSHVGLSLLNNEGITEDTKDTPISEDSFVIEPVSVSRKRRIKMGLSEHQILQLEQLEQKFNDFQDKTKNWSNAIRFKIYQNYKNLLIQTEQKYLGSTMNKKTSWLSNITDLNELDDEPSVNLGDASMASPFTYRGDNISAVITLIKIGKATLAHVMMSYKLLTLNSLTTAFSLSVLTLAGMKFGERQLTAEALFCMVIYVCLSFAQPGLKLTEDRIIDSLGSIEFILSVLTQSAVHITVLCLGLLIANKYQTSLIEQDGIFRPNLLNTIIMLVGSAQHISNFIGNYESGPILTSWNDFKFLKIAIIAYIIGLFYIAFEINPKLNILLEFVIMPNNICKYEVIFLCFINIILGSALGIMFNKYGRIKNLKKQKMNRIAS